MHLIHVRLISFFYIAYIVLLVSFSLKGFPQNMNDGHFLPYLSERPIGEDAYYMLTIAWNVGSGYGPVYNYDTPATGVQPLATMQYAMLAWFVQKIGGGIWLFLRFILLLKGLELLLFGHIIGKIAHRLAPLHIKNDAYFFGLLGVVYNFSLFRLFTYGLETGIYLILFASCVLYSFMFFREKPSLKMAITFGILGGLTIWARIDFGIVFFSFLGLITIMRNLKLPLSIIAGIFAIATSSPWFLYVFSVSNRWIPSSGPAQSGIITLQNAFSRISEMGVAILEHLTPWFYFEVRYEMLTSISFFSLIVFVSFLMTKKKAMKTYQIKNNTPIIIWLIAISILIIIYITMFRATHFYMRYSSPLVIPVVVAMAILISKRVAESKILFFTITTIFVVSFLGWAYLSLHTGRIGVSFPVTAGFIQEYYSGKKVGAFQSGVIGFFNPNVINLDGKVNQTALDYTAQDKIHEYIDNEQIDILIDWQGIIYSEIKDTQWLKQHWEKCAFQVADDIQQTLCLQRKTIPTTITP